MGGPFGPMAPGGTGKITATGVVYGCGTGSEFAKSKIKNEYGAKRGKSEVRSRYGVKVVQNQSKTVRNGVKRGKSEVRSRYGVKVVQNQSSFFLFF